MMSAGAAKEKYVYTYDWKHRKVKAQRYLWNAESGETGAWALVSENRRYYDEWNLIYEVTENGYTGTTVNKYYYGADIASDLYSTGGTSGLRMANLDGSLVYVFNNQTGNVEALYKADSSNELLAEYEYTPFGETRRQSGELAEKNPLRYSTRYHEGNTGLYYYGFRHYSPVIKKWLSQDPIGEKGGLNLYGFANNNPMNYIDVLGLCCEYKLFAAHGAINQKGEFVKPSDDYPAYGAAEDLAKDETVAGLFLLTCYSKQLGEKLKANGYANKIPNQRVSDGVIWFVDPQKGEENFDATKPRDSAPSLLRDLLNAAEDAAENLCKSGKCPKVTISVAPIDGKKGFSMKDYVNKNRISLDKKIGAFNKKFSDCSKYQNN